MQTAEGASERPTGNENSGEEEMVEAREEGKKWRRSTKSESASGLVEMEWQMEC